MYPDETKRVKNNPELYQGKVYEDMRRKKYAYQSLEDSINNLKNSTYGADPADAANLILRALGNIDIIKNQVYYN